MTRLRSIAAALAMVAASLGIFTSPAAAHETRTVGPYVLEVGWAAEPAIVGQPNGLFLAVADTAGTPVTGLAKTLRAEVIVGGGSRRMTLDLGADPDRAGQYTGPMVPTRTGDYTFHISGTIGTTTIDERFESGPNRFDSVGDASALQFPDKILSNAVLASKLDDANTKLTIALALGTVALVLSIASLAMARRR